MELIRNKRYLGLALFGLFNILLGALERLHIIPASGANPGIPNTGQFFLFLPRPSDITQIFPEIYINTFCSDNFVGCAHSILQQ